MSDTNYGGIIITNPNDYYNQDYYNNRYKNITNVSELNNYYLAQPNNNQFIIKCSNDLIGFLPVVLITGVFTAILVCLEIFAEDDKDKNEFGKCFGIGFVGWVFTSIFFALLMSPIRPKIVFEEIEIKLTIYYLFFCIHRTITYQKGDIKKFEVIREIKDKANKAKIIYYDKDNLKRAFPFTHNFTVDEAEYFVYIANNYV